MFYRRKQKRSYWPLLRAAVFLGGFERRRQIARLDDGSGVAGGNPMGAAAGGDGGKDKKKKDKKARKNKKKKGDDDGDGGSGEDEEEYPLPPDALAVALNHLNLPLATSRLWEMGACLTSVDLRHNRIERVLVATSSAAPSRRKPGGNSPYRFVKCLSS